MLCCGSAKTPTLKQNLATTNFPELVFTVKNSKLKFDNQEGVFKQVSNDDPTYRKNNTEENKVLVDEDILRKNIALKKDKINYIKTKVKEIDEKIKTMTKILNVDVDEKEYVESLKTNL